MWEGPGSAHPENAQPALMAVSAAIRTLEAEKGFASSKA
jgi:hypothetical protein